LKYEIRLTRNALDSIDRAVEWWALHRDASQANRLLVKFFESIELLKKMPKRCSVARESVLFAFELRELHFGVGKRITHRALFRVEEDAVVILQVRQHQQNDIQAGEVSGD
jgi:plasmid stabilization system protein ParE